MTTTLDISSTITSTLLVTQTQVVKGIMDLYVDKSINNGITLDAKDTDPISTVSTIRTASTTKGPLASAAASHMGIGSNLFSDASSESSSDNSKIGLAIGIPIAIVGSIIIVVVLYLYLRYRRNSSKDKNDQLQSYYDEKYNYRISPVQNSSPLNLRTTYQIKTDSLQSQQQPYPSQFDAQSSTIVPNTYSIPSIKNIPQGQDNNTKWQTPIQKWFNLTKSAVSSRASLSTGIFSPRTPGIPLREFNLKKQYPHNDNDEDMGQYNEKSPILPSFPEKSYMGTNNYSTPKRLKEQHHTPSNSIESSPNGSIRTQVVQAHDTTRREVVNLQHPLQNPKTQKALKNKATMNNNTGKPLPKVPSTVSEHSIKSLVGLEQVVLERMIPTTPMVDFAKYKNNKIYKVSQSYERNLADELSIIKGDLVKILARHTDGWCLVEKCDKDGNALFQNTNRYINDGRGVIPELCLQGTVE
ncbi:Nuclear fusion protein [Wickerhamomyces ciferrii]|uniref:Nuclear fusion protein n=1 Tax=Wickerhamomyces ciferrii (strain ATCC 14091 / BCRC 22168 / CBS 111 / JCM 3599 / NBRC 0793 / NRRL Y-1031 F-60-10) TaxID=1206466 RepID=K0KNQ7_WICCF|nr:Nuclear fusion protein [Wickerhamomyces ciferrii]CCH43787.1 Nuclear fusion protein [Wickerhamomyces ciferrii]